MGQPYRLKWGKVVETITSFQYFASLLRKIQIRGSYDKNHIKIVNWKQC